ncbi:MAG: bifunctional glutamate N-acetyltransferase/amino-acid acetyltransferase ArgJ [Bradymonadia bacterium]
MSDIKVDGFRFAGISCGIKRGDQLDLGLIVADEECPCAGVFTTNQVVAAPVVQSKRNLSGSKTARAIIVNSGNANACTGQTGVRDAATMSKCVADQLGCSPEKIQVCSTGVIGAYLPMDKITKGVEQAIEHLSPSSFAEFSESIRTTDTFAKLRHVEIQIGARTFRIAGASKGAGMIHPNMATMLGFVVTDAPISADDIDALWRRVCQQTFNAITIDGDTSTNDTALFMASGAGCHEDLHGEQLIEFEKHLLELTTELAKDIVRDAEGGTKVVGIRVAGARSFRDAQIIANTIALSPLVKTAIHGEDPNWGRIIAAAGRSGVLFEPNDLALKFNEVTLYEYGEWCGSESEAQVHQIMLEREYLIELDIRVGDHEHTVYTCDFSADYVRINADYRS